MYLLKFICKSTNHPGTVFGDWAFKVVIKVKWGHGEIPNPKHLCAYKKRKRHQRRACAEKGHVRTQQKADICEPRKGLIRNQPTGTLILDCQSPELWGNKLLSVESCSQRAVSCSSWEGVKSSMTHVAISVMSLPNKYSQIYQFIKIFAIFMLFIPSDRSEFPSSINF